MRNPQPSPLAGMFRSPVGAWVRPVGFKSGAVWFRSLPAVTLSGVVGLGYSVQGRSCNG